LKYSYPVWVLECFFIYIHKNERFNGIPFFLTMTMADIFDLLISLNFKPIQHENREAAEVHISHKRYSIK